ncbi:MAG: 50S ribosomal protein L19e, partial [Candidatus Aenigmarchaeota archaeon]|nr:50S ribosomal protein L19e [Candidatus Aenigmarchaeota archaeon]
MKSQKTMASKIMKCGASRVWLDPTRTADIDEAITSEDVRRLIRDGVIAEKPKQGLSSFRKNKIARQKKKGRRRNRGSVKGKKGTR